MYRFRTCLLLAFVVMLSGCASQSATTIQSTRVVVATTTPIATPVLVNLTPLSVTQAWGGGHIKQYPVTSEERTFTPRGGYNGTIVTDDGNICGALVPPPPSDYAQSKLQVQSLAVFNLHTSTMTTLQVLPMGYQLLNCQVAGQWIVWNESLVQQFGALASWKLSAINLQTHEVRILDHAETQKVSPPSPLPSASHDNVVWLSWATNQTDAAVMRYDFLSGQRTVLTQTGNLPDLSWPWASWEDLSTKTVSFQNLETQQHITRPYALMPSALAGTSFVTSDAQNSQIRLYPSILSDQNTASSVIGNGINGDFVEYPTLNDRLVTWNSNETLFAFDRKLQRPVQILSNLTGGPQPFISGHYMLWETRDPQNASKILMDVIDTDTLP